MAGLKDRVYKLAPVPLQNMMVSLFGLYWNRLRFSGAFEQERAGFLERERYTSEQWRVYVEDKLRRLLVSAFDDVPYYREAWREIVTREALQQFTPADLPRLPVLEKRISRDAPESLLVGGAPQKGYKNFYTSGSTGTPIKTYWLPEEKQRSLAMRETRSCGFAGVSYKMPRATFSGRMVEPDPNSRGPYHRFNFVEKQVYFSAFHLGPKTVSQYIEALRRHHIVWITGYSNSIYQMAQLAEAKGLDVPPIKAVITTSEKITPEMREVVERVLHTQVYEEYGTVEDLFYACECEHGRKHINPDAGIIEVVDENLQPVPFGVPGEVLATGFIRPSQPHIRFRIGDVAVLSDEQCPCGRAMPVLSEVVGRMEDTVYGLDGRRMVRFHGIFVSQPHVQEGQIVQERLNLIRVRIVPKPGFSDDDRRDIASRIHQRLGDAVNVEIELVDAIERTKAGKFRAVVSKLRPEDIPQAVQ